MTATPIKSKAALRRHGDEEHADHPAHTKSTNNAAVAESDGPKPKRLRRTTATTSSAAPAGGFVDLSIDLPVKKVGGTIELLDDSDDDDDATAHVKAAGPDAPSAKDGGRAEEDSDGELSSDFEDNDSSSDFEDDDASSTKKKAPAAGRGASLKSFHSTGMDALSLAVADEGGRANGVPSASNSNLIVIDSDDDDDDDVASSPRKQSTESSGNSRAGPSAGGIEDHLAGHLRRLKELLPDESKEDLLEMAKQNLQEEERSKREEKARPKQGDDDIDDDDEEYIGEEKVQSILTTLQKKNIVKSWRGKQKGCAKVPFCSISTQEQTAILDRYDEYLAKNPTPDHIRAFSMPEVTKVVPREMLSEAQRSSLASVRGERGFVASGGLRLEIVELIGRNMTPPITSDRGLRALRCIGLENLHRWRINCEWECLFDCLQCGAEKIVAKKPDGTFSSAHLRQHERSCRQSHDEPTCPKCGQTPSDLGYTGDRKTYFNLHEGTCISQAEWDTFIRELTEHFAKYPNEKAKIGWHLHKGKRRYNVGVDQRTSKSLYRKTRRLCGLEQEDGCRPVEGERAQQLQDKFGFEITPFNPEIYCVNDKAKKGKKN